MNTSNQIFNSPRNIQMNLNLIPTNQKNNLRYYLEDFCFPTSSDESIISKSENDQKVAKINFWDSYLTNQVDPHVDFYSNIPDKVYLQELPTNSPKWLSVENDFECEPKIKKMSFDYLANQTGTGNIKGDFYTEIQNLNKYDPQKQIKSEDHLECETIEKSPLNQETISTIEFCTNSNSDFSIGQILSKSAVSDALADVLIKTLSNQKVNENEIEKLSKADRLVLFVYLNKRSIIPDSALDSIGEFLENTREIVSILDERSGISNCNESGLAETIINRVIRFCFEDWIKNKNLHIFNGKYKLGNKKVSNEQINQKFWQELVSGKSRNADRLKNFEKMILKINNSIQIKKKKLTKRRKQKNISIKKPKYLNIFFKKKLKQSILKCVKSSPEFRRYLAAYKKEVISQYKLATMLPENEKTAELTDINCKFTFQLKLNVRKAIGQIMKWFSKNGENLGPIPAKMLKVRLKHIACPVTLKDYLNIFEIIEKGL